MATTRPFAYNTGSSINGTNQIGDLAIGVDPEDYSKNPGGVKWWNGPDEDLGYVIAYSQPDGLHPTQEGASNKLTLNPSYKGTDVNLSNNNQTAYQQFGYQQSVLGNTEIGASDKVMFSVLCTLAAPATLTGSHFIGIGYTTMNYQGNPYSGYPGNNTNGMGYSSDGNVYWNGNVAFPGLPTWGNGDIIDIAISSVGLCVRVNGGYWNNNMAAVPGTNLNLALTIEGSFFPVLCPGYEGTMVIQNKPQYGVPADFQFLGNTTASVGFLRSEQMTDESFLDLVKNKFGQTFSTGVQAKTWLNNNGYWTSYLSPVLSLDAADYTSGDWVDSVGGKQFTLYNSPTWSSNNGGYFNFNSASAQYAKSSTSLSSLNRWSVAVWHYYDGTNVGSAPCIVTETFVGGGINYSLGKNNGPFSAGFFDGGWRVTDGYSLTPNNWYYIVGTYDGATVKLYVNNALVDSVAYAGTPTTSGSGIRLMERWDLSNYWGGRLATVDIYDKAMTASQISSIYNITKSRFGL